MRNVIFALALRVACHGQELTLDALQEALVERIDAFDSVALAADGKPEDLSIKLGETPVKIRDDIFGGFRFRCPELAEDRDFVWYFNVPEHWGNWYILPVDGKAGEAFRGWLDADKLYKRFDKTGEKERLRVLQSLDGDYFTAGAEYLIWFRKSGEGTANDLRGRAAFGAGADSWDHDEVEKALGLEVAAVEDQVAALSSRGGLILLDDEFFERRYAEGRIDSVFFSIRQTKRMSGGYFITMQIAVPPCETRPSLAAIIERHGPPDFTRTGLELARLREIDDDERKITRHYFDHFAFEVDADAEDPKVLRVVTLGSDFSALRPPAEGHSFASIDIENLTVFHRDGKEVGRAYYFLEGEKEPVFIKEPPPGEFRDGDRVLVAKGGGEWIFVERYPGGKTARRFPLKGHRFDGKAEGFRENGKRAFTADYRRGGLHGELVKFDEAGEETSRRTFEEGEPAEE